MTAPRRRKTARRGTAQPRSNPWLDPGSRGERLDVEDFLTYALVRLGTLTKNNLTRRYLEAFGLSLPEWRLLSLVARSSPQPFGELVTGSGMDKGQVSRTLHALHGKGLVRIDAVAAGARRVAGGPAAAGATAGGSMIAPRLEVTVMPKGRAVFRRVMPAARDVQVVLLGLLDAHERDVLHQVSHRLIDHLAALGDGD